MPEINRRKFMQLSGGLGLSTLLNAKGTLASQSGNSKLGVALVGLGQYSEGLLAPALELTTHCELRGIVTGSPQKIPKWQQRYGIKNNNIYSYRNMHELANNPDIDIVYVVVPTALHLQYCEIAANAGKHVWCEKPMALTVEQCQRIIDVCHKNKVKLSIGYRMQHEPNTRRFMQYKSTAPYGKLTHIVAQAGYGGQGLPADNWRMQKAMGGGAMYDMGVYPLNGCRFMTGLEPVAITAKHEKSHPDIFKEVDETTYFTLEFPDGLIAECATSVVKSFSQLTMNCSNGWYSLRPMSNYTGVTGYTSDQHIYSAIKQIQQAIQMDDDTLALLGKGPLLVPGEEGMRDIQIVQAAFASAAKGQRISL
ncbi:MAG: Gfo/Idh/MocA family oxidoreductase [Paraglaciecola sp.]|uniref:Gfo/Idh/MocA family protein n=1 Tax=Paraglaciecola sp. TaxID=1920173 RepID=UPI00273D4718|nr:Gfo/Idh/MocA family oxidoreductase [Paraglaciecola sp.]MDP5031923.1 Gfo/Idh/MocA family oxidoreductase [Paraglaciecola sp.]MDP5134060.1 Gfo/Idh/MocA family oxidoreductase [Paraglaciecola sp.]